MLCQLLSLLSGQASRNERLDRVRVGDLRAQPPCQVLQAHRGRPKAPSTRTLQVGGLRGRGGTNRGPDAGGEGAMIWNRLKYLWPAWRRRQEREMREELESLKAIAGDIPSNNELGNLTLAMENARATWGWTWLESIVADIRYALRALRS